MCGLAGFNVSKDWAEKYLDNDKMAVIAKRGWEFNLHRGTDAAGYMRFDAKTSQLHTFKTPGSASAIIGDRLPPLEVSNVMALHTRAFTNGEPKFNENNHPVGFKGVWVTHNGNISNHEEIKKNAAETYGIDVAMAMPEVDSVAIPIVLSDFQPWDLDNIADSLADLQGGYSFHAVWEDHPGVSLIVRGKMSPLIVRYHPAGGFVYASEDDATWQLIDAMGLNANDDNWVTKRIDEYTIFLVVDGVPVDFKSYKRMSWGNKTPQVVKRLLPQGKDKVSVVSVADSFSDWSTNNDDLSLNRVDPKEVELLYARDQGFTGRAKDKTFPLKLADSFAKLSEADAVYKTKDSKQIHAFYDNVELVLSEHGSLRDVYHHDVIDDEQRWVVQDRHEADNEVKDFDEFLTKNSISIRDKVDKSSLPTYFKQTSYGHRPLPQRVYPPGRDTDQGVLESTAVIGRVVDYNNFWHFPMNKENDSLYFFSDEKCEDHSVHYVDHAAPLECETIVLAAIAFYSCFDAIDLWTYVVDGTQIRAVSGRNPCRGLCDYEIYNRRVINVNGVSLSLPVGERCKNSCGNKRFVMGLPEWITDDDHRANLVLIDGEA